MHQGFNPADPLLVRTPGLGASVHKTIARESSL